VDLLGSGKFVSQRICLRQEKHQDLQGRASAYWQDLRDKGS
jgi:hypothetical protein